MGSAVVSEVVEYFENGVNVILIAVSSNCFKDVIDADGLVTIEIPRALAARAHIVKDVATSIDPGDFDVVRRVVAEQVVLEHWISIRGDAVVQIGHVVTDDAIENRWISKDHHRRSGMDIAASNGKAVDGAIFTTHHGHHSALLHGIDDGDISAVAGYQIDGTAIKIDGSFIGARGDGDGAACADIIDGLLDRAVVTVLADCDVGWWQCAMFMNRGVVNICRAGIACFLRDAYIGHVVVIGKTLARQGKGVIKGVGASCTNIDIKGAGRLSDRIELGFVCFGPVLGVVALDKLDANGLARAACINSQIDRDLVLGSTQFFARHRDGDIAGACKALVDFVVDVSVVGRDGSA